jgi:4-amino-4-deoxy-L-arabinose transferase-like glycosyltransferase
MKTISRLPSGTALLELIAFVVILLVSYHFVSERIRCARFPGGDQGSWMGAAAQVARGEGFTTRWLEFPFLKPAGLPRPDDLRYPGLVFLLALSFKVFGVSYPTALWTAAIIYFIFMSIVFCACRQAFGRLTAILSSAITAVSLLQLQWNTIVYSEGLFGIVAGALILWSTACRDRGRKLFWIVLGAGCGVLYCVRPNGVLFGAGILWLYLAERKKGGELRHAAIGLASMAAVMLPWLVRTWYWFGSPFHLAANAMLFRGGTAESIDRTWSQFVSDYGLFYPVKAVIVGIGHFGETLQYFEHGLQLLPLLGVAIGLAMRRRFYNPFVAAGFFVTFLACCYASRIGESWDGVRFFSPLLPFVYGYGISSLLAAAKSLRMLRRRTVAFATTGMLFLVMIAPVYHPHEYYERTFGAMAPGDKTFHEHTQALERHLAANGTYMASSMAQLNFLYDYNCVGIPEEFVDSTCVKELIGKFSPTLLVVTQKEFRDSRVGAIMREIRRRGGELRLAESNKYALYWKIGE